MTDRKEQHERIKDELVELARCPSYGGFIEADAFAKTKLRLDAAILINVLHVIPSREERLGLLRAVSHNLKDGGLIFVGSPYKEAYYRDLVRTAIRYADGLAMRRGGYYTFYKDLPFEELRGYVEDAGFLIEQRIFIDHRTTFVGRRISGRHK